MNLVYPTYIYLIWRLGILIYQVFFQSIFLITMKSETILQRIFISWTSYWDAGHYTSIALDGYRYPLQAFFPLLPVLIKTLSLTGLSVYISSFILSFLLGLITFILFYFLAVCVIGKDNAKKALLLFSVFPSTMYLLASYTEGLFLSLTLLSFLLLEKKKYLLSSIVVASVTMTRLVGIAIVPIYLYLRCNFFKKMIYVLIALSGLIFYGLYLRINFGDFFLFATAHKDWCEAAGRCNLTFPLKPLVDYGLLLLKGTEKISLSSAFLDWFFAVSFIFLLYFVFKKLDFKYFSYSLIIILLPLSSGSNVAMVRLILVAFPIFFILPNLFRSKILLIVTLVTLLLLQLRFIALFTNKIWVA